MNGADLIMRLEAFAVEIGSSKKSTVVKEELHGLKSVFDLQLAAQARFSIFPL